MTAIKPSTGRKSRWLDPQPGRQHPRVLRNGVIFTVLASIFLFIIYTRPSVPFLGKGGFEVHADLPDATNIRPGYTPVRVYGIEVGQVTSVKPDSSGRGTRVAFHIDAHKGVDVRRDARASVRWRTLLGRNVYVDLQPGSRSAPPLGDQIIPRSRTSTQTELDQTLEPLDSNGRQAVKTLMSEFDKGFNDPKAVGGTLDALAPAARNLAPGLRALRGTRSDDLTSLISASSRAMGALSRDELALGQMVTDGSTTLSVLAARRSDLAAMLTQAPGAMHQARTTLVRLNSTLDVLDSLAVRLRPGARALQPAAVSAQRALDAAVPLLREAQPMLADLRPSVAQLRDAANSGVTVITALTPTIDRIRSTFLPWLRERDNETKLKNYETIGPALGSASSALSQGDRYGAQGAFEANVGEGSPALSPCTSRLMDAYTAPQDKINCELVTRALRSLLSGQPPTAPVRDSAVPQKVLAPLLQPKNLLGRLGTLTKTQGGGR